MSMLSPGRASGRRPRGAVRGCMATARVLGKLRRDTRGAVATEYGLLVVLAVIAVMLAISALGQTNYDIWRNVAAKVTAAT
ncbi:Flp family type IVb pilin [Sphingomonas solaris]|uniref:Flp family type IVb pilin n=1 Tax=Alterirhizorhabdus solaris TaxID=2529389 RepID=A0A558R1Q1_9SPHN|nr:hypothetical protein [Sphingomonas solaris]TVV73289.1 hypothetical protein FOY91_12625 [Sphingomonas solaris]